MQTGILVLDEVFDQQDVLSLQKESGFIDYKVATLAHGERQQSIRGDRIRWIDEDCPIGMDYLRSIMLLAKYFNQTLYAGIRRSEDIMHATLSDLAISGMSIIPKVVMIVLFLPYFI